MEAQASLVGANGTVELYAVAKVYLHLSLIVHPGYAEGDDTFGFHQSLNELGSFKLGMLVVHVLDGEQHFVYGLQVLLLSRMFGL